MSNYSESQLIIPALLIVRNNPGISTSDLIIQLEHMLAPDGEDIKLNPSRSDSKFSQKVRNLVSHHKIDQQGLGFVKSEYQGRNWYHTITPKGREHLDLHINELYKTAVEVGINGEEQLKIALCKIVEQGGKADINSIYDAVESQMRGFYLSDQGKASLRYIINHVAVEKGYVHPYDKRSPGWSITPTGEVFIQSYIGNERQDVPDEVEGLDSITLSEQIESLVAREYPIDNVLIRYEQRTVYEIMRRINNNVYILDPDFQRDFVWDEVKQSKLIESVLMRIPLPVFYLAEREDGKIVVVDGLQRLMTFRRYLGDELSLRLADTSPSIHGKLFSQLPSRYQQRIEDTQLIVYMIDPKVPERVRLDIFERVNSGVPLSRQQMRNSIYMGEATRLLKRDAVSPEFLEATGGGLSWKTMRDRELINRYYAFTLVKDIASEYKGDMDEFLARTLEKMNQMSPSQLEELSSLFRRSMKNNFITFGPYAFRRHTPESTSRSVINVALFDVFSALMARYSTDFVQENAKELHEKFFTLIKDAEFVSSITLSTNSVKKVMTRFQMAEEVYRSS